MNEREIQTALESKYMVVTVDGQGKQEVELFDELGAAKERYQINLVINDGITYLCDVKSSFFDWENLF